MKHAARAALARLSPILTRVRRLPGLKERTPGVFYRSGKAFLHFHEDPAGLFADLRRDGGWRRLKISDAAGVRTLLGWLACSLVLLAVAPAARGAGIESLGWLTGCWQEKSSEGLFEEYWTAPAGKTMLQMGRMTAGGRTVFSETLRIQEEGGRVTLLVTINGSRRVEFEAVELSEGLVVFKTPPGSAPETLRYERVSRNKLSVRLEKIRDGTPSSTDFRLERVNCRRSLSVKN